LEVQRVENISRDEGYRVCLLGGVEELMPEVCEIWEYAIINKQSKFYLMVTHLGINRTLSHFPRDIRPQLLCVHYTRTLSAGLAAA
jgi:hypothetical protein